MTAAPRSEPVDDEYFRMAQAAAFAKLSVRTLCRAFTSPHLPLRHYRFGRRVVIARRDLVAWIASHRAQPVVAISSTSTPTVQEILTRLNRTPGAPAGRNL